LATATAIAIKNAADQERAATALEAIERRLAVIEQLLTTPQELTESMAGELIQTEQPTTRRGRKPNER
jgi:hypothetical protein